MPDWTEELRRRLRGSGLRAGEADVIEELSQHLEDRYHELRAQNVPEAEAERLALAELDAEKSLARAVRQAKRERPEPIVPGAPVGSTLFGGFGGDIRHALRLLGRTPGFTLIAAAVIALGIGANTAMFSVVNAVLLRPLPGVRSPSELVAVYTSDYSGPRFGASSYPDYEAMQATGAFASAASYTPRLLNVTINERAVQVLGEAVSPTYFDVLGVSPARGRFFLARAGVPDDETAVVISHDFWQRRFAGATDIIGRPLRVNGTMVTIVGIAPASFSGMLRGARIDVWVPLLGPAALTGGSTEHRGNRGLFVFGRLRQGVTLERVRAQLAGLAAQLHAAYPEYWTDINRQARVFTVLPEAEARVPRQMLGAVLGMFAVLMTVVVIVLLIACSNVANLMMTRASARMSEMGVRLALGATRGRIVRQLLTESVLLAGIGGAAGVLLALWLTRAVNTIRLPVPIPFTLDFGLDVRVLVFAVLVTVFTGIIFGLLPALQASRAPAPVMKGTGSPGRMRMRNALVVVQVASSLVLLAGAGLLLRSLSAAQRIDPGIARENMLLVPFDLASEGFSEEDAQRFYTDLQERVAALPGVVSATLAERVPLGLGWSRRGIVVEGYQAAEGESMEVPYNGVGPDYFEAMGIRLVRGRGFTGADRTGAPLVMVVNEAFARRYWPGQDPIGRRIGQRGPEGPFAEVIGLAPDAKYRSLTEDPTPYFYYPYLQDPSQSMTLQVRTAIDPRSVLPAVRGEVRALAPLIAMPEITTLEKHLTLTTLPQRVAGAVFAALGALALLISGIGLYGVVAYTVAQRMREFGIRTALGAPAAQVQRMVVGQGLRLALIGVLIGTAIAMSGAWVARSLLFVSPFDPIATIGVIAVLTGTAALASWIPARRATRVDPLAVLRAE